MIIVTSELKHGTIRICEPTRNNNFAVIDERAASGNNAHCVNIMLLYFIQIVCYIHRLLDRDHEVKTTGRCKKSKENY